MTISYKNPKFWSWLVNQGILTGKGLLVYILLSRNLYWKKYFELSLDPLRLFSRIVSQASNIQSWTNHQFFIF